MYEVKSKDTHTHEYIHTHTRIHTHTHTHARTHARTHAHTHTHTNTHTHKHTHTHTHTHTAPESHHRSLQTTLARSGVQSVSREGGTLVLCRKRSSLPPISGCMLSSTPTLTLSTSGHFRAPDLLGLVTSSSHSCVSFCHILGECIASVKQPKY